MLVASFDEIRALGNAFLRIVSGLGDEAEEENQHTRFQQQPLPNTRQEGHSSSMKHDGHAERPQRPKKMQVNHLPPREFVGRERPTGNFGGASRLFRLQMIGSSGRVNVIQGFMRQDRPGAMEGAQIFIKLELEGFHSPDHLSQTILLRVEAPETVDTEHDNHGSSLARLGTFGRYSPGTSTRRQGPSYYPWQSTAMARNQTRADRSRKRRRCQQSDLQAFMGEYDIERSGEGRIDKVTFFGEVEPKDCRDILHRNAYEITIEYARTLNYSFNNGQPDWMIPEIVSYALEAIRQWRTFECILRIRTYLKTSYPARAAGSSSVRVSPEIKRHVKLFAVEECNNRWAFVIVAWALYELSVRVNEQEVVNEKKRDPLQRGGGGSKSLVYDEYVRAEFATEAEYRIASLDKQAMKKRRTVWIRRKAQGDKMSQFINEFGPGVLLCFPSKVSVGTINSWSKIHISLIMRGLKRGPEKDKFRELCNILREPLAKLLSTEEPFAVTSTDGRIEQGRARYHEVNGSGPPSLPILVPLVGATRNVAEALIEEMSDRMNYRGCYPNHDHDHDREIIEMDGLDSEGGSTEHGRQPEEDGKKIGIMEEEEEENGQDDNDDNNREDIGIEGEEEEEDDPDDDDDDDDDENQGNGPDEGGDRNQRNDQGNGIGQAEGQDGCPIEIDDDDDDSSTSGSSSW